MLANQIGVTRWTTRPDIDYLRDQLNAPIEFDSVQDGSYYNEPTFCLPFPQLTQGEMLSLYLSEPRMRQFRGTPFERNLRQSIKKLSERLPDRVSVCLDSIADFLSVLPAVYADYAPKLFSAVMQAVVGRRRLKIVEYAWKTKAVVIRHRSHHDVIAMVEIVSPGNKSSQQAVLAAATPPVSASRKTERRRR